MKLIKLKLSWSTSRGVDTYGYNICRLDDCDNKKRYRTNGVGYDMVGTVFGEWLADVYQERLLKELKDRTYYIWSKDGFKTREDVNCASKRKFSIYGSTYNTEKNTITLDGACGFSEMTSIADMIGLELHAVHEGKGKHRKLTGWIVSEKEQQTAKD